MLTEYVATNSSSSHARQLLYCEFPEHYVWNNQSKHWKPRKKHRTIGRIVAANPLEGERYFLRILLIHIKGATSFTNLRTINGITYNSFREAVEKYGLLEKDNATEECLIEASTFQMPFALRRLFATLLVFCEPNNPRTLWDKFYDNLSEDYKQMPHLTNDQIQSHTLNHIANFIESMGKKISDYDLPAYNKAYIPVEKTSKDIEVELNIPISDEDLATINLLNNEHRIAYNIIMHHITEKIGGCFFIDGRGGTGKTFLYKALLTTLRSKGLIVLATASTGIAASNLPGGHTAHSHFKIPLDADNYSGCNVSKQSSLAILIRKAKLIIWDEASMKNKVLKLLKVCFVTYALMKTILLTKL
ncbi:hypothetical protein ACSBR2_001852 [Camellia fascicularis]